MAEAERLGFDACRVAAPDGVTQAGMRLVAWLQIGAHGDMTYMAETSARRADPRVLWPEVQSVVMLGLNYAPSEDALAGLALRSAGNISVYARHRDYHDVLKGRLKLLAGWLTRSSPCAVKVFVDTAPVMEKPLAATAGLGWQGKHTNLVSRDFGSWLFLGAIFTTLRLEPDRAETDHCGSCRACLDVCPTAAFPEPYRLDARRCISYLTIEHKGHIDAEFRAAIGNRIYGCDDCLAVCPWNKFAQKARETRLQARADLCAPPLCDLADLDEPGFRARFSGSPIKRIGHARFMRNVLIAIGNSRDRTLRDSVLRHLRNPSPLVRAMAVWAAARLSEPAAIGALAAGHRAAEDDPAVSSEWDVALSETQSMAGAG